MNQRYRYSDCVTEEGVMLALDVFNEVKPTPQGAWVVHSKWHSKKRFVLNGSGKRYCHQTKELAWTAYQHRKLSQRQLARDALAKAEYALEQMALLVEPPEESRVLGQPEYWSNYVFD